MRLPVARVFSRFSFRGARPRYQLNHHLRLQRFAVWINEFVTTNARSSASASTSLDTPSNSSAAHDVRSSSSSLTIVIGVASGATGPSTFHDATPSSALLFAASTSGPSTSTSDSSTSSSSSHHTGTVTESSVNVDELFLLFRG